MATYRLHLEIAMLPKSLNKSLRANRWRRNQEMKEWAAYLATEAYRRTPEKPLERAKVTLVRHSYRTLDYDGLVGSMKPVVDGLVGAGIIRDDSWKVLGRWDVDQRHRPKSEGPLLEIQVEQIG